MRAIVSMALKDLRLLFRVRAGLFFTFVWPVIVAVLFGYVFSGQSGAVSRALPVAIVDEDGSDESRAFVEHLRASGDFAVQVAARAEAETLVRRGERAAMIVLERGYGAASTRLFYGAPRQVEIGADPSRQAEAAMIEGLLTKHAMSSVQRLMTDRDASRQSVNAARGALGDGSQTAATPVGRLLSALDEYLATPGSSVAGGGWEPLRVTRTTIVRERRGPMNGFAITFPQGMLWGIIGCVMSFAISLVSERVRGTFVRLQMAPVTRAQILSGKALACFIAISSVQAMLIALGALVFDVRPTSPLLLLAACVCASAGFVGFMMMVAGFGRNEQAVSGAGWALLMPMAVFGGAMMPQFVMPPWMQAVGSLSPIKWAILGIEGAVWRGFTPAEMVVPCGILLAFGAVCFVLGVRALKD